MGTRSEWISNPSKLSVNVRIIPPALNQAKMWPGNEIFSLTGRIVSNMLFEFPFGRSQVKTRYTKITVTSYDCTMDSYSRITLVDTVKKWVCMIKGGVVQKDVSLKPHDHRRLIVPVVTIVKY